MTKSWIAGLFFFFPALCLAEEKVVLQNINEVELKQMADREVKKADNAKREGLAFKKKALAKKKNGEK